MNYLQKLPIKHLFTAAFIALLTSFSFSAFAEETEEHPEAKTEEKFDAGKMIIEHISDAHDWHIMDLNGKPVSLPLPVILYTPKGVDVFMSSKFEHGHAIVSGKYNYKLEEQHVKALNDGGEIDEAVSSNIIDLSITKNVATLIFSSICLLWIFLSVAGAYKRNPNKTPSGLQSFMEPLILFIRDEVAKPSIGAKYEKFVPYLLTVFFLILFNNLLGLVQLLINDALLLTRFQNTWRLEV